MKCEHIWKQLYGFEDEGINYDVFYCVKCLKQTSKERECPKEMRKDEKTKK